MHNYHINIAINGIFKKQLSFSYMLKFICILRTKEWRIKSEECFCEISEAAEKLRSYSITLPRNISRQVNRFNVRNEKENITNCRFSLFIKLRQANAEPSFTAVKYFKSYFLTIMTKEPLIGFAVMCSFSP
ncbi:conserved hypothetical protein [Trichinella spiralis]|uniref:hypothetical protein n=1 Tax=Trichinella spiralis TaxID=6334 RepID=UPI0001EFD5DC|nr:conserved hypothetical protein [Trichinella spiralis]